MQYPVVKKNDEAVPVTGVVVEDKQVVGDKNVAVPNNGVEQLLRKELDKACQKKIKRPTILVCGYTGTGKSSLIRAILGDIVPEEAIGTGKPQTMGFDCYESDLIKIYDSKGLEAGETEEAFTDEVRRFIRERQSDSNIDNHIHLVWYTIQGPGARVTECDKNLIKNLFRKEDVIVVITKSDVTRENQKEGLRRELLAAGVAPERIIFASDEYSGSIGCRELMMLSHDMLPDAYRDAFMEAQRVDVEAKVNAILAKRSAATAIIATYVSAATATGAIPLPGPDAPILMAEQTAMIGSFAVLYRLAREAVSKTYLPLLARAVGLLTVSAVTKALPGVGSVVSATVAGSLTAAMGWYVQRDFERIAIAKAKGGPLPELRVDFDEFCKFFKNREFEKIGAQASAPVKGIAEK